MRFSCARSCAQSAVEPPRPVAEAGEVLQARAVVEVRVALEVEVEVAVAGWRQPEQPEAGLGRQQGARRFAGLSFPELLGGLLAQSVARLGTDAGAPQLLVGSRGQAGQGRDPGRAELVAVVATHERDQPEVVGLGQLLLTPRGPAAADRSARGTPAR